MKASANTCFGKNLFNDSEKMKIAIEELLAAMDLAAAKALGQQQYNLLYAGAKLIGTENFKAKPLLISGNVLEIQPEILRSTDAAVTVKITVAQKNASGKTTASIAAQSIFVKLPGFDPGDGSGGVPVFSTVSAN